VIPFLLRLGRFLRQERPQIFHGYLAGSNSLGVLMRPIHGARVVWGLRASDLESERHDWFGRLDVGIERWLSRFPDRIIANSHAGRDFAVAQGFPKDQTVVVPNGIDAERFRPDEQARRAARARLGVDENDLLVGRIGRMVPQKDYPSFLRAAAEVARQRCRVRFLCVGSGPDAYERQLRGLGEELGLGDRLIWSEARDDMPAIYNALDVMVSSSAFGEGLPNVVAEAMASGVPCVVTDSGDSAWVVGNTGRVVPRGDVQAIATATIDLLDAVAGGEIDRAALRQRVVRELSLDGLVERTEAALRPLVTEWSAA
jgi:glycosyltransferase involved in cell wall biosynthesis